MKARQLSRGQVKALVKERLRGYGLRQDARERKRKQKRSQEGQQTQQILSPEPEGGLDLAYYALMRRK